MQVSSVAWLEGGVWRPCLGTERKREPETEAETHGGPALKGEIDDTKGFPESVCVPKSACVHLRLCTSSYLQFHFQPSFILFPLLWLPREHVISQRLSGHTISIAVQTSLSRG